MNEYMIVIHFTSMVSAEFASFIPAQRIHVNRLMEKGIVTSYSLAADRSTLWMTLFASSSEAVEKLLRSMPLYPFMRYDAVELLFHNRPVQVQMHLSLN